MAENTYKPNTFKKPGINYQLRAPASGEREFLKVNIIMIL